MKKIDISLFVVLGLSFILFFSRLMPHEPNLTPVLALCLFAGFLAKGRGYYMLLPLLALGMSDWMIGFYPGWGVGYMAMVLLVLMGSQMNSRLGSFVGTGFVGAVIFFLVSNFGVWMYSEMYPPTLSGLLNCYQMGIPFFRATLTGTLLSQVVLFIGYTLANKSFSSKEAMERI